MSKVEPLRGVIAPVLTPFNDDGSVATDLFVTFARSLLDAGCAGLAPFGTTGEALSLGIDERMASLDALIAHGIAPTRLIPGTGLTSLADTARLTAHATDRGCAGAMVLPPFYYKGVSEAGLAQYYAALIDAVGDLRLRLYLYHIPQVAGVGLPVSLVRELHARFPQAVVGIKDSSGDWANTADLLAIEGLIVYPSSETTLPEALPLGAAGCISATANLNAGAIARLIEAIDSGCDGTADLIKATKSVREAVAAHDFIAAQKAVLAHVTGDARWRNVRPPLMPASADLGRTLANTISHT